MPDSLLEPLTNLPSSHHRYSVSTDSHLLPTNTYEITHEAPEDIELSTLVREEIEDRGFGGFQEQSSITHYSESAEGSDSTGHSENDRLVAPHPTPQMKRSKSKRNKDKSPGRPELTINTERNVSKLNGHANGSANGHANGHTKSSMDSNIEMRRKHASNDEIDTDKMMHRHDFSLDNEPHPQTPATPGMTNTSFSNLPPHDKRNFLWLVLLYFIQGIPLGLASGSVPFLLKKYLSYGQIGVFSLAIYPYSLKLLWSPIVDAVWSPRFGRRKSWIVPIQTLAGFAFIYLGRQIDQMMQSAGENDGAGVWNFTWWWFLLVFLCATQDIAVDGWAISLLSMQNISYASTAQTVGLTAGSFLSHTVFLALQSEDFANTWFWKEPHHYGLVNLGGYMEFFGWVFLVVTLGLAALKTEAMTKERDPIMAVYRSMWAVLKLPNIQSIIVVHLIAKLGFVTNDAVTNLKLLDKGFGDANMALVVLIDFPFELSLGYYAGKWSTEYTPLRLWCWAFVARLLAAVFAQITIMIYPVLENEPVPFWYMLVVIAEHVYSTFMNTVMFVAVSAFHARIADPSIGGTYMTLLATVANLGGTFPKFFILKLVDLFTSATCMPGVDLDGFKKSHPDITPVTEPFSCALRADRTRCKLGGGNCIVERDGYYITNLLFVIIGAVLFFAYIRKKALALQALPLRAWRVATDPSYRRLAS